MTVEFPIEGVAGENIDVGQYVRIGLDFKIYHADSGTIGYAVEQIREGQTIGCCPN